MARKLHWGKVVFYHERKRYGFVESDDLNADVFFNEKDLDVTGLTEGTEISFLLEESKKGEEISKVISENPQCQTHGGKVYHDTNKEWLCPHCEI